MARRKTAPPPSMTFEGMEDAVAQQLEAAALYQTQQLEEEFLKPLGDINKAAGEMERNAPLFYGTGDNPILF